MLLLNHPPLSAASPSHLKALSALQALAGGRSAFFTAAAPGDAEREELWRGTLLFGLSASRRAYLYLLRSHLGAQAPGAVKADQLARHQLLSAELFAAARNAYAKAGLHEQELVAYFLSMRCALRSGATLPGYLQQMAEHYAEWVSQRAETLARQRLGQHDLPGFLAMNTIAASAYQDNTASLGAAEQSRKDRFTERTITSLHEYLKAHQARLPRTDVAMVQRAIGLTAAVAGGAAALLDWQHEVVARAPSRAATGFLQEAAEQDRQRNKSAAAWWWAHAAEALEDAPQLDAWQMPFMESAAQEAAKRLGELATQAQKDGAELHTQGLLIAACHRLVRKMPSLPSTALQAYKAEALVQWSDQLRQQLQAADVNAPSLSRGLDAALLAALGAALTEVEGYSEDQLSRDLTLGLRQVTEMGEGAAAAIVV